MDDDLRYEMEERYARRPIQPERSSFAWLGIIVIGVMLGTLAADAARLMIVNAWARYQMEQMQAELNRAAEQQRLENQAQAEARQQQQFQQQQQQIQQQQELEFNRKLNSDECQFWTATHQVNPSSKTQAGMAEHCP